VYVLALIIAATAPTVDIDLGRGVSPHVSITADGSRLLIDATGDASDIEEALSKVDGAIVERITTKHVWASIPTAKTFTQARTRGSTVSANVGTREDSALERLRERTPDFGSIAAIPQIKQADAAIARGKLDDAKTLLSQVAPEVPGRAWAELRSADVAILLGAHAEGCSAYAKLSLAALERTASLVAIMRAHAFACEDAPAIDWAQTLRRTKNLEGGVGLWMAYEILATAGTTSDPHDIDAFISMTRSAANWPQQLRSVLADMQGRLLARGVTVRMNDRMSLAVFVRAHSSDIGRHVDGKDLRLDAARALLDLDLADDAVSMCNALLDKGVPRADAPFRTWRILADAYIVRHDDDALKRLSGAFEGRYHEPLIAEAGKAEPRKHPMLSSLDRLEARLKRLKSHVAGGAQ
jgi:hypothetical protein